MSLEAALRLGRIGTVGVLVPGSLAAAVEDPSTALLLRGIVEVSELADVGLTSVTGQRADMQSEPPCPMMPGALRGLVDGVVMHCLADDHPVVEMILARRIPAVAIDSPRLPGLPYVTVDHRSPVLFKWIMFCAKGIGASAWCQTGSVRRLHEVCGRFPPLIRSASFTT